MIPIGDQYFLDFHTHRQRHEGSKNVVEIVSIHLGQDKPHQWFTIGLHPWWTQSSVTDDQSRVLRMLLAQPDCLAMGEMGLDKLKGPPLDTQSEILKNQLVIAEDLNKPVIIHCVRAFDPLIQIKKEFPGIPNWCIHGYGRHMTLAKQLIDQGFYLSIMPSVSNEKFQDFFASLPSDRLFLETDSMPEMTIEGVYQRTSNITKLSEPFLRKQMNENAQKFFTT
jgi:TatD DNase family protein